MQPSLESSLLSSSFGSLPAHITLRELILSKKAISSALTWTDYYSKFKKWKISRFILAKQKPRTLITNLETKSQRKTNQQFPQEKLLFQQSVTILVLPPWPWEHGEWLSWQHCLTQCCKGYSNLVQLFLGANLPFVFKTESYFPVSHGVLKWLRQPVQSCIAGQFLTGKQMSVTKSTFSSSLFLHWTTFQLVTEFSGLNTESVSYTTTDAERLLGY